MIKKFYYDNIPSEYYIYYTTNDHSAVIIDDTDWPELIRNELVDTNTGRLVFNTAPTYIPGTAFSLFGSNLVSVYIPNSVTSIGDGAFLYCNYLNSINLPDSVTVIGDGAFSGTGITTPLYNSTIFAYLQKNCVGGYTIPNGITTIVGNSLQSCEYLTSVTIPDSVTHIGEYAFNRCDLLTTITIGSGITNIGKYAFLSLGVNGVMTCNAINPPTIDTDLGSPGSGWTLYVPANSVSLYLANQAWSNAFSRNIQAITNS